MYYLNKLVRLYSLGIGSLTTFLLVPFSYLILPINEINSSVVKFYYTLYIIGIIGVIIYNVVKIENYDYGQVISLKIGYLFLLILIFLVCKILAIAILLFIKIGVVRTINKTNMNIRNILIVSIFYLLIFLFFYFFKLNLDFYDYTFFALIFVFLILNFAGYSNLWIPNKLFSMKIKWNNIFFRLSIDIFYFLFSLLLIFSINNYLEDYDKSILLKYISALGVAAFIVSVFETQNLSQDKNQINYDKNLIIKIFVNSLISFSFIFFISKYYLNYSYSMTLLASFTSFLNVSAGFLLTIFRRNSSQIKQFIYSLFMLVFVSLYIISLNYISVDNVIKIMYMIFVSSFLTIIYLLFDKKVLYTITNKRVV